MSMQLILCQLCEREVARDVCVVEQTVLSRVLIVSVWVGINLGVVLLCGL